MYTIREGNITPVEKLANEFKAQKQFFARVDIFMKFFDDETMDRTNDNFAEMYAYFTGFLKNISKITERVRFIRKLPPFPCGSGRAISSRRALV